MLETSSPLRIVLVQDNENDRLLFRRAFQKSDVSCEIIECSRAEEALEQLGADAQSFDVVAVDNNLPGISGMDLCRKLLDKKIPTPLVLLADMGSEQLVAEALKAGVRDYIIKDPEQGYLELLPISLINIARRHVDHYSYKQVEKTLQNIEKAAGAFFDAIPDTAVLIDTEGNILVMNKAGVERLGRSHDEIIGKNVRELFPEDVYELRQSKLMEVIRTGNIVSFDDERDGICFETWLCPVFDAQGKVESIAVFAHDITLRKLMENKLATHAAFPDQNPNPVLRISRDGLILNANRASEPVLRTWGIELGQCVPQASRKRVQETLSKGEVSSWEFTCDDGRVILFKLAPVHDNDYLNLYGMDVTENKKAQEVLEQSEEKFRLAMETTDDALWDWNLVTNELYRNPRHATMLGYEPHELTASQCEWEKLVHPDDKQSVLEVRDEYLSGKRDSFETMYRLRTKAGDYVWVLGRGKVVAYNNDGSPARMIGTNIDITERKKLRERDKIILKTSIDGFWLVDTHGRILDVNDAYCRMSGYSRDELLTMSVQDVEEAEAPQEILEHIQEIMDKGSHRFETRHRRKDGTIMDLDISVNYLELDGGRTFAFFRDITGHKNTVEALRKSEATYRTLVEQLPAITYTAALDETSTTLYVSPQVKDLIGFTVEEYKSDPDIWRKQLHPDDRDRVLKTVSRSHAEKKPFVEEYRMIAKNGSIVWFRDEAIIVKDEKNQPLFLQGVMYDITEYKSTEEALQESELRYRTLFEILPVGVGITTFDGRGIDANSTMLRMMGSSLEEIKQSNAQALYHNPDERTRLLKQLQQDGLVRDFETEFNQKDGSTYYTNLNMTAMKIRNETVLVTVAKDITEQRQMKKALTESEEKYRTLVECARDSIYTADEKGVFLFANTIGAETLGYQPEELVGKTLWDLFPKEIAERQAANVRKVIETGQGMNSISLTEIQNKPRWYSAVIEPLKDDHGRVTTAMIIARDVDDMKRAEQQIQKLSSAVEQSIDGIAIGSLESRLIYVNDSYARMHGYTHEELIGRKVTTLYAPDKANVYENAIQQVKTKGAWRWEVEHIRKDGSSFPAYLSVSLLKDDNGETVGYIAVCRNMTDYRQTQEMLEIKNAALESSINGIVIGNIEGNLTYVNNSFLKMWGYEDQGEVLGRKAAEFWKVNDKAEELVNALQSGEGWIGELNAVRKDGSLFDIHVCQTSIRNENGTIISLMASFVDITESKRREEELNKYRGQMARAEQLASLGTLSATVAHQLTQPLTVIRLSMDNALDELQAASSSETVIRRLKDSVSQVSNITSIIENFRNFARKSSGKTVAEVNLKSLAVRIARLLSESARSANIVLRVKDMGELPFPWMNEADLEQLFFALIENSIQAADGKKTRQLLISGVLKDKHIELRLSDDCGGISPENLDKIFEPFFTTKPRGQGTGLGLCIVQDVVSRADGHVRVENEFGKGTTFIISLPVDQGKIS